MKLFFIALLINIIFFLWEYSSGGLNLPQEIAEVDSHKTKQILLVTELPGQDGGSSLIIAENKSDLYGQLLPLEPGLPIHGKTEEDTRVSSKQLIKSNASAIEGVSENLLSSNEPSLKDQREQNILQHDADTQVTKDQVDSKEDSQKNSTTAIEELPENLKSSNEQSQNDQSEQNTLQHDADTPVSGGQINSVPKPPVLEEKPLTVARHEEVAVNSLLSSNESNAEQAVPDNNNYCYHVGPFANGGALNVWRKLNKIDTDSVKRFNKKSVVVFRYLTLFPAAETFAQSRKNVQRLKQKGITDYWLFRRGELRGAISLGLFSKQSRALAMQEKLAKAGFTIEIKERYKKRQQLYAEISTKDKTFKDIVDISDKQTVSECEDISDKVLVREWKLTSVKKNSVFNGYILNP